MYSECELTCQWEAGHNGNSLSSSLPQAVERMTRMLGGSGFLAYQESAKKNKEKLSKCPPALGCMQSGKQLVYTG